MAQTNPPSTPDTTPATTTATATAEPAAEREPRPADALVEDDLLVEDVSIDGMCGVY